MQNSGHGAFGGASPYPPGGRPDDASKPSLLSLVLLLAALIIGAVILVGVAFWALGLVFSVAGLLLRVALVVAVAALVWRRVVRGRSRRYDY
jgi:hypothetical protein